MLNSEIIDRRQAAQLDAYVGSYDDNADLYGEYVELSTDVEITLPCGIYVGLFTCNLTMRHDGNDWDMVDAGYRAEWGEEEHGLNIKRLRNRGNKLVPIDDLTEALDREVLHLLDVKYNKLADEATVKAREALEQ